MTQIASLQLVPSVENPGAVVSLTFNYGRFRFESGGIYGVQCQDHFVNLERRRDREVSVHTTNTSRSQSRSRSQISHEENIKAM